MSAKAGDGRASLRADLEFHRTICRASRNEIAATLWNAIARHVLVIFSLEPYRDKDLSKVARQHEAFRDWILEQIAASPPLDDLRTALEDHLLLVARTRRRTRGLNPATAGGAQHPALPAPEMDKPGGTRGRR